MNAVDEEPFLASLKDTAEMIEELRSELATVEKQRSELAVKVNEINTKIAAFNGLRQAHGLAPL